MEFFRRPSGVFNGVTNSFRRSSEVFNDVTNSFRRPSEIFHGVWNSSDDRRRRRCQAPVPGPGGGARRRCQAPRSGQPRPRPRRPRRCQAPRSAVAATAVPGTSVTGDLDFGRRSPRRLPQQAGEAHPYEGVTGADHVPGSEDRGIGFLQPVIGSLPNLGLINDTEVAESGLGKRQGTAALQCSGMRPIGDDDARPCDRSSGGGRLGTLEGLGRAGLHIAACCGRASWPTGWSRDAIGSRDWAGAPSYE